MKLFQHVVPPRQATFGIRSYLLMLDFSFGMFRTEQNPGLAVSLFGSRSANMDRFVEFSINIGYFMLWFSIGPANLRNDKRSERVLAHDLGYHHWDLDRDKYDPIGQTAFVFQAPHSAPEYVFILSPPGTWSLFDAQHITDGVDTHKLNGWCALTFQELHELIHNSRDVTCITKDGEERYDPFLYVRVQDFLKYLN